MLIWQFVVAKKVPLRFTATNNNRKGIFLQAKFSVQSHYFQIFLIVNMSEVGTFLVCLDQLNENWNVFFSDLELMLLCDKFRKTFSVNYWDDSLKTFLQF